jgi:hypothetical protein
MGAFRFLGSKLLRSRRTLEAEASPILGLPIGKPFGIPF